LAVLFCQSFSGYPLLYVLPWLSYPSSTLLSTLLWQACPDSPVLAAIMGVPVRQPCPGSLVLPILLCLSSSSCPVQDVLFCLSCSTCPILPVLVLPVLFCLPCTTCPVLVFMSWLSSPYVHTVCINARARKETRSAKNQGKRKKLYARQREGKSAKFKAHEEREGASAKVFRPRARMRKIVWRSSVMI
jgi:hypothetical protein